MVPFTFLFYLCALGTNPLVFNFSTIKILKIVRDLNDDKFETEIYMDSKNLQHQIQKYQIDVLASYFSFDNALVRVSQKKIQIFF